eukprot:PhF_6_TR11585/c1_g1_i1/m.18738
MVCKVMIVLLALVSVSFAHQDWLLTPPNVPVTFTVDPSDPRSYRLSNGLITKIFTLDPTLGFGLTQFYSHVANMSILRAVGPEAIVLLDNVSYNVGDMYQQEPRVFLNLSSVVKNSTAFQGVGCATSPITAPYPWKPGTRGAPVNVSWPPKGLHVECKFIPPTQVKLPSHKYVSISVHHEMYQDIPVVTKYLTITSNATQPVVVNNVVVESLAVMRQYAPYPTSGSSPWNVPDVPMTAALYAEPDIPHAATLDWVLDPDCNGWWELQDSGAANVILQSTYVGTVGVQLTQNNSSPTGGFRSFRVVQLVTDTNEKERHSLSRHRMNRILSPQIQENPIFFHGTDGSSTGMRSAVDQLTQVGFEMFIYSFGSGFNLESTDPAYLSQVKADISYANTKGIEVGGYDLICLDRSDLPTNQQNLNPDGSAGGNACFASNWVDEITSKFMNFVDHLGLSAVETDGPYGGESCASTQHEYHQNGGDSVYWQNVKQSEFFAQLRTRNVYIHQPDNYFYQGGSKTGMGYNENQYSLPRWMDLSVSRMGMYDDTFINVLTQGWMFVPLVQYHGGGDAAAFEPLTQNYNDFSWAVQQYLLLGIMPCWRGYRIFDSNQTLALVKKYVGIYKQYRDIITSDLVHVKRADMQSWDAMLHVNPLLPQNKGFLVVFNPTQREVKDVVKVPMYYTGLHKQATVLHEGVTPGKPLPVSRDYTIDIPIDMPPKSITWFVLQP